MPIFINFTKTQLDNYSYNSCYFLCNAYYMSGSSEMCWPGITSFNHFFGVQNSY